MGMNIWVQAPINAFMRGKEAVCTVEHLGHDHNPNFSAGRPSILLTARHRPSRDHDTRRHLPCAQHMRQTRLLVL